jgi:hypothetical protein
MRLALQLPVALLQPLAQTIFSLLSSTGSVMEIWEI